MTLPSTDTAFAGSIPELYDSLLVPLLFEPYAADLARRISALQPDRVLETAAGTGALTRALAKALPADVELLATDLNQAMLTRAAAVGTSRPLKWQQADATRLPFDDACFDIVACQFGMMFLPDKAAGLAEARRVLRPGGSLLFNVWDRIEHNEIAQTVTSALAGLFSADPPLFMARTPHGYFDPGAIAADLLKAGFDSTPRFETVTRRSRAASATIAAIAYCQGTPLRNEIEARVGAGAGASLAEATAVCAAAIAEHFGTAAIDGKIQAIVVSVDRT